MQLVIGIIGFIVFALWASTVFTVFGMLVGPTPTFWGIFTLIMSLGALGLGTIWIVAVTHAAIERFEKWVDNDE